MSEQKKVFIDRDHFDERVRLAAGPDADEEYSADFLDGIKVVLYMLSTETPADVKPVVKGEWIPDKYDPEFKLWCSVCDWTAEYPYNFCPNCGAEMRPTEKSNESK